MKNPIKKNKNNNFFWIMQNHKKLTVKNNILYKVYYTGAKVYYYIMTMHIGTSDLPKWPSL
jgi:hypothetical protein